MSVSYYITQQHARCVLWLRLWHISCNLVQSLGLTSQNKLTPALHSMSEATSVWIDIILVLEDNHCSCQCKISIVNPNKLQPLNDDNRMIAFHSVLLVIKERKDK